MTTSAAADYRGPTFDITVSGSDDWSESFTIKVAGVAQNLTGETWAAAIKGKHSDSAALVSMTVDDSSFASGIVTLSLTDAQIAALVTSGSRFVGVWSLKRTVSSNTRTWCRGRFTVELQAA